MKALTFLLIALAMVFAAGLGFVYGGIFKVAADEPHWGITLRLIEATRERSIRASARNIGPPPVLSDPALIASGGQEYAEMCTGCHLAPGMKETEIRAGLYPKPPNLSEHGTHRNSAETFWVIKHGLKMTGMPAWGLTHDDRRIWGMVAFLQKLPELSQGQYEALIGQGGAAHAHESEDTPAHVVEASGAAGKAQEHADSSAHAGDRVDGESKLHVASNDTGSAEAVALVDSFFKELAAGNTKAASALLDPGVLIYESGGAERSREEYAAHHLPSDAKFLKSVKHRLLSRTEDAVNDLAWVASEATLSDTANGKRMNMISTETMILRKRPDGWRIVHIHWSNRSIARGM